MKVGGEWCGERVKGEVTKEEGVSEGGKVRERQVMNGTVGKEGRKEERTDKE